MPLADEGDVDTDESSILVLNAGSSSLKFALFAAALPVQARLRGEVSGLGSVAHLTAHDATGALVADHGWPTDKTAFHEVLAVVLDLVDAAPGHGRLCAVAHRIVQGGADHMAPERLTPPVLAALDALVPLDPIHMPHNLAPVHAFARARPDVPQFACFDTAFHRTMPLVARNFALPRAITAAGVRRYGFHGLSYEYIAGQLALTCPALAQGRVIVAHLGAGASLCGLRGGISIATTFGISVLDGLVMGTRCGSLDPGVIFTLARMGHSLPDIETMLYDRSGLLGVSGISGDVRVLLASADPHAREAIDLFVHRLVTEIGATAAALGGLDGIVFTGGIGEHAAIIRAEACAALGWLGVTLDPTSNAEAGATMISRADSRVEVPVNATDEEAMIAHHVLALRESRKGDAAGLG
ncbi:acetate/propionate family kinase [Novosphingobium sp.]|uniref:acetate/propionate family kinase n=1 Tax=Novosphingobium sp. TaxID=1874826 RepID=UPI0038BAA62F